ncbi:MAG: phosphotransferase [Parvibaculum sp.]
MGESKRPEDETINVRDAHRFDTGRLEDFCLAHVDGFVGGLEVRQFSGGQSNPTFLLTSGPRRYVMRKKPPGTLLASAHQVDREYRVMKALAETDVPVPTMQALCMDPDVIGTEFYIMDHLDGRVLRDPQLPGMSAAERKAIYDEMNANLARLHSVDYKAIGLEEFGRPGNYYERQIGRWIKQYRAAETETVEPMEQLITYLPQNIPHDDATSIAHGDYRLENTMFHPTEPRMIAVLDWELSTIGHPLADLAYNCMLYHFRSPSQGTIMDLDYAATGIPAEDAYVAAYCKRTRRDRIENWDFYLAFSIFRLASITQGVYKRGLDGNASSSKATEYGDMCRRLADAAWAISQRNC